MKIFGSSKFFNPEMILLGESKMFFLPYPNGKSICLREHIVLTFIHITIIFKIYYLRDGFYLLDLCYDA